MIQEHMYSKRYAKSTIEAYLFWIAAYIRFNNMQHPSCMGDTEVELYLNHLVNTQNVAQGTQAQALNALSFLYKEIIKDPLSLSLNFVKSERPRKLPVVLTQTEVTALFKHCITKHYLACALLYGSGIRLMEAVKISVHDIDFDYKNRRVWNGKGNRIVTLAEELVPMLRNQLIQVDEYLQLDLKNREYAGVWMPHRLSKKYPSANKSLQWQFLFPSHKLSADSETGEIRRYHLDHSGVRKAVKLSSARANIYKHVTHILYATHSLRTYCKAALISAQYKHN